MFSHKINNNAYIIIKFLHELYYRNFTFISLLRDK